MTVRQLYEWAKDNNAEDCTIKINMGSYGEVYYITPEIQTVKDYNGSEHTEVVL